MTPLPRIDLDLDMAPLPNAGGTATLRPDVASARCAVPTANVHAPPPPPQPNASVITPTVRVPPPPPPPSATAAPPVQQPVLHLPAVADVVAPCESVAVVPHAAAPDSATVTSTVDRKMYMRFMHKMQAKKATSMHPGLVDVFNDRSQRQALFRDFYASNENLDIVAELRHKRSQWQEQKKKRAQTVHGEGLARQVSRRRGIRQRCETGLHPKQPHASRQVGTERSIEEPVLGRCRGGVGHGRRVSCRKRAHVVLRC